MKLEHLKIIDEVLKRWPGTTWMAMSQMCPNSSFHIYFKASGSQYKARLYSDGTWALSPRGVSYIEQRMDDEGDAEWSVYEFEPEETYDAMRPMPIHAIGGGGGRTIQYEIIDEMRTPEIRWHVAYDPDVRINFPLGFYGGATS